MKVNTKKKTSLSKSQKRDYINCLLYLRQERIIVARNNFYEYCKTRQPEAYTPDKPHLKILCDILQALYERRLINKFGIPYRRLMLNMPPRHFKTRTLVFFSEWILGKNKKNRIIACSHTMDKASDFSRYTRDGIIQLKTFPYEVDYSDLFPESRIKQGNKSLFKWALEGEHFNYKGTGINGNVTGTGCNVAIADDVVKDASEAYNELALDKVWLWYSGTFISRFEKDGIEIMCMTRWAKKDPCGRLLELNEKKGKDEWYVLKMPAYNEETGKMLCPSILNKDDYEYLKSVGDANIFLANYQQEPVDIKGKLYSSLKTYNKEKFQGKIGKIYSYTDTADTGKDYLCSIAFFIYDYEAYILDVYYTPEAMEVTEVETARLFYKNKVRKAQIESNNGGRSFARKVEEIFKKKYGSLRCSFEWFHQRENKIARILTHSSYVVNHIYFPENWRTKYPQFYMDVTSYQKEGRNKRDDAPDCLTGIAEMTEKPVPAGTVQRREPKATDYKLPTQNILR